MILLLLLIVLLLAFIAFPQLKHVAKWLITAIICFGVIVHASPSTSGRRTPSRCRRRRASSTTSSRRSHERPCRAGRNRRYCPHDAHSVARAPRGLANVADRVRAFHGRSPAQRSA